MNPERLAIELHALMEICRALCTHTAALSLICFTPQVLGFHTITAGTNPLGLFLLVVSFITLVPPTMELVIGVGLQIWQILEE